MVVVELCCHRWAFKEFPPAPVSKHGVGENEQPRGGVELGVRAERFQWPVVGGFRCFLGGLLFHGEVGGDFAAVDAKTGKTLYRFRTNDSWRATPMTYSVGGRQYIAGMAGQVLWSFALGTR